MKVQHRSLSRLRKKTRRVDELLRAHFGTPARRGGRDALSSLIQTILSQNTSDLNSGRAFGSLREKFPAWSDVLAARASAVAKAIRMGGLAEQKSRRIKDILSWLRETRGDLSLDFICDMETPEAMSLLSSLSGVGPKTASVVLLFACGREVFPVDTHIHRVSIRLGLVPEGVDASKAHEAMAPLVPEGAAYPLHINMIRLGRTICRPRRPLCNECPLSRLCPKIGVAGGGE